MRHSLVPAVTRDCHVMHASYLYNSNGVFLVMPRIQREHTSTLHGDGRNEQHTHQDGYTGSLACLPLNTALIQHLPDVLRQEIRLELQAQSLLWNDERDLFRSNIFGEYFYHHKTSIA